MSVLGGQLVDLFPLDGKVLTSGGSLDVTNGVVAIVETKPVTSRGRKVVASFDGQPKDKDFQILLGAVDNPVTRSTTNKPYESLPFKISEVKNLTVVAPQTKGIKVDDFIIGYNGKNGTELTLKQHSGSRIELTLCGEAMYALGYHTGEIMVAVNLISPYLDDNGNPTANDAVTMQEIVENAVKEFKNIKLLGGNPITDYVDIIAVNSENENLSGNAYVFYSLNVVDAGTEDALARVQAQYPTYKVHRTDRIGDEISVYTILAPTGTVLADYDATPTAGQVKGCADCAPGYSVLGSGFVYSISIENDGADVSGSIDDLPGFVAGTVVKLAQNDGVAQYSVVVSAELTDAQIAAFKAANALKSTAVITLVGEVADVCANDAATVEIAWVSGNTCYAQQEVYEITVPDDECGNARLAEIQANYPDLTIAIKGRESRAITLTGTEGTANINVGGVNYLATFATSLTVTATNFVTAHASALSARGFVVTAAAGVLTFSSAQYAFPTLTITNATTNLAGTVGALTIINAVEGMCQTTYTTRVTSDVVCAECSNEFRDLFETVAPKNFKTDSWTKAAKVYSPTAKMGIRFIGKEFVLSANEYIRDNVPFYATSTRLKVAGGQPYLIAESWNSQDAPYAVKVLSIAAEPEALGGQLWQREDMSRTYFDAVPRFKDNNYANWLWGRETRLKGLSQYVQYALTVDVKKHYLTTPHASELITYQFIVEVGQHTALEGLLNKLAAAAGLPAVQAFGNV